MALAARVGASPLSAPLLKANLRRRELQGDDQYRQGYCRSTGTPEFDAHRWIFLFLRFSADWQSVSRRSGRRRPPGDFASRPASGIQIPRPATGIAIDPEAAADVAPGSRRRFARYTRGSRPQ